jgi:hypothetical protein
MGWTWLGSSPGQSFRRLPRFEFTPPGNGLCAARLTSNAAGRDIEEAMAYTIANLQEVRDALPHSRLAITEAGWATLASEFGARASEEKQKRYYHDLYAWTGKMNITTFFFEAFDEDWKGNPTNPFGAEKHWGLFTTDRKPKPGMRDLYPKPALAKPVQ